MREFVIEPGHTERHYWRELWRYRELFAVLAWRDVAVRYKQTAIGVGWGYHPAEELMQAGALSVARDFGDLADMVLAR